MSFDVVRRSRMRSILQITLDRSQADTLAEELAQSRRVGRLLQPALRGLPLGIDLTDPGVLRRRDGFVTIYVHSAGQSAKLRQLVPRLERVLAEEGLRDQIGILCDGTVVPCCLDAEGSIALGNIFRQSLDEILNSERAKALYRGFSNRAPAEELCLRCGYAERFSI